MNNQSGFVPRRRSQSMIVVEGNHEKNKLFSLLFDCFPELHIDKDDIWIYGTNIYQLYNDIVKEYGDDWIETDIDLPFVVSKKKYPNELRYKSDFINIILVFDYERQDPNFSEEKTLQMQSYFKDAADVGQLYINYPMVESYQELPDSLDEFLSKKWQYPMKPGKYYKKQVKNTIMQEYVELPNRFDEILFERFHMSDQTLRTQCIRKFLSLNNAGTLLGDITSILVDNLDKRCKDTAIGQFYDLISRSQYVKQGITYWQYMRQMFQTIIKMHMRKAIGIQLHNMHLNSEYEIEIGRIELDTILSLQNEASQKAMDPFIWILNTCIFIIPEYNGKLLK